MYLQKAERWELKKKKKIPHTATCPPFVSREDFKMQSIPKQLFD